MIKANKKQVVQDNKVNSINNMNILSKGFGEDIKKSFDLNTKKNFITDEKFIEDYEAIIRNEEEKKVTLENDLKNYNDFKKNIKEIEKNIGDLQNDMLIHKKIEQKWISRKNNSIQTKEECQELIKKKETEKQEKIMEQKNIKNIEIDIVYDTVKKVFEEKRQEYDKAIKNGRFEEAKQLISEIQGMKKREDKVIRSNIMEINQEYERKLEFIKKYYDNILKDLQHDMKIYDEKSDLENQLKYGDLGKFDCEKQMDICNKKLQEQKNNIEFYENPEKIKNYEQNIKNYEQNIKKYKSRRNDIFVSQTKDLFSKFYEDNLKDVLTEEKNKQIEDRLENIKDVFVFQNQEEYFSNVDDKRVPAYYRNGKCYVNEDFNHKYIFQIIVHEFNHYLSANKDKVGVEKKISRKYRALNEAINEYFVMKIMGDKYPNNEGVAYIPNAELMKLMETGFGKELIIKANYLNDRNLLKKRFNDILNKKELRNYYAKYGNKKQKEILKGANWDNFIKAIDALQPTYGKWIENDTPRDGEVYNKYNEAKKDAKFYHGMFELSKRF